MKITLSLADLLDGIYAESALAALAASSPSGIVSFILTPDNEAALRRIARDAFAATIALAGDDWAIAAASDEELSAEYNGLPTIDSDTLVEKLRTAATFMLLHLIYACAGSQRASSALESAKALINTLVSTNYSLERIAQCNV